MTEKWLKDPLPSAEERYEWQSFLALLPALDLTAVNPLFYQRCLAAVWRLLHR